MLRMSTLLLRTLRDDPADAEVASHRLLVRAGFVEEFQLVFILGYHLVIAHLEK